MATARLSPDSWINAGFEALVAQGPSALKAEVLARQLKTTKGSFYWHFKDVPAFQEAMLTTWHAQALEDVLTQVGQSGEPDTRLRTFGQTVLASPIEPKLRIWAASDTRVANALAEVDAERLQYLTRLLGSLGLGNPDFARALQATLIGLPFGADADGSAFETLVDTVLALS